MGKKSGLFLLCGAVLLFCLYAVRISYPADTSGSLEVQAVTEVRTYDSLKKPVTVSFSKIPERVIINRLNGAETLMALGAADRIIAVNMQNTDWGKPYDDRYMEQGKALEKITYRNLTKEEAVLLNPDLIIGWKSTFASVLKKPTAWWNERGVRTYVVSTSNHLHDKGRIEDECRYLDDMGQIFDVREKTDRMIREIHDELSRTQKLVKGRASQSVMVVEPEGKAFYNYDNGWVVGDMVEQLGGYMPAGERRIGYEDLISYNPDVLFVVYFNEEQRLQIIEMFRRAEFSSLKSVRNQRVYPIPFDHMYTPAIKTIDGLRIIRNGLYPDLAKKEGEKE